MKGKGEKSGNEPNHVVETTTKGKLGTELLDVTKNVRKDENENISENTIKEISVKKSKLNSDTEKGSDKHIFLVICIIGVTLAIALEIINSQNRPRKDGARRYWVYSAHSDVDSRQGIMKHVHNVLENVAFEQSTNKTPWHLLWSHDYPFRVLYPSLHRLKPHQRVNHFPGTGFITNKVDLATSNSKYIPKAFKLPKSKEEFLKYASENKNALFLEKHNQHRGIHMRNVSEIDLSSGESFVQEYIQNPFLVDGHKFDIGVYVVVTSVNPLRIYWYKGDVLFRYCPAKYHPFDPRNLDKYVIGDDYLPTWEVPSLALPYTSLGFSMKDSFDIYARSQGKDTKQMWAEIEKAIAEVFLMKEHHIVDSLKHYPSPDNFFEMMRFDLMVDEDLKVYLLEANMSPNLSSAHYPPNQLLYEQVLYNLFSITGVSNDIKQSYSTANKMVSSQKNIAVYGDKCSTTCKSDCNETICELCTHCMSGKFRNALLRAHREFLHKGDFKRLFPPPVRPGSLSHEDLKNLTKANQLQYLWYQGKCNLDSTWCY